MKEFYLDTAATTKGSIKVVRAMQKALRVEYGNPSSKHEMGRKASSLLETARETIAKSIGAKPAEVIFTSGGTESNNLAIQGLAKANPSKKHIITSQIEHASMLDLCKQLQKEGYTVEYIAPTKEGFILPEEVSKRIRPDTLVVSIMHSNNEIGTLQPIKEIAGICKKKSVPFHSDAVQSFRKVSFDVKKSAITLLSVSAHKIGGPKGVGALYIKSGTKISPIIIGGGQEQRLRSGTQNLPGIVGFAAALEDKIPVDKIAKSRDALIKSLLTINHARLNGSLEKRLCNNVNISFFGIEAEALMLRLSKEGIHVSTGSACASSKMGVSHVLESIGCEEGYCNGSIRLSIPQLTATEIGHITKRIKKHVEELRLLSPFKLNVEE